MGSNEDNGMRTITRAHMLELLYQSQRRFCGICYIAKEKDELQQASKTNDVATRPTLVIRCDRTLLLLC